ncbi:MAG: helix-turn-helix domain-containing protein [Proteobacteria bacterium]|jgi:ribosome-binding protein aMBF1 (putative translation factor)|nr:helix-turn-helix domain-containing protein [Pseudomonadota bacterium]
MVWDSEKIRDLRLRMGWSISDLARRLQLDSQEVKSWEVGEKEPASSQSQLLDLLNKQAEMAAEEISAQALADEYYKDSDAGQCDLEHISQETSDRAVQRG